MSEHKDPGHQPEGSTVPTGAVAAQLHERVNEVLRVLEAAQVETARKGSLVPASLIERYGDEVEARILAIGDVLAEVIDRPGDPVDLEALREEFLAPILVLSRSLPVYNRAAEWRRNKFRTAELSETMLAGRAVGFDAETLLLDNFYVNMIYARALRARIVALAQLIREEAVGRFAGGAQEMRVLVLGASSVLNLASLFRPGARTPRLSAVIVDGDTKALRRACQQVEETLGVRPAVERMTLEKLAKGDAQLGPPFDLVFTLMQYDLLTPGTALGLTRSLGKMLAPGGALLTGTFLPSVPKSYRAVATVFAAIPWQYWDEPLWREMLDQSGFDLPASRFETLEPATITVLARRKR